MVLVGWRFPVSRVAHHQEFVLVGLRQRYRTMGPWKHVYCRHNLVTNKIFSQIFAKPSITKFCAWSTCTIELTNKGWFNKRSTDNCLCRSTFLSWPQVTSHRQAGRQLYHTALLRFHVICFRIWIQKGPGCCVQMTSQLHCQVLPLWLVSNLVKTGRCVFLVLSDIAWQEKLQCQNISRFL